MEITIVLQSVCIGLLSIIGWFLIKLYNRFETVETKQREADIKISIIETNYDNMKETLNKIDRNVEKTIDKLQEIAISKGRGRNG